MGCPFEGVESPKAALPKKKETISSATLGI
jgi:hypothetical protein